MAEAALSRKSKDPSRTRQWSNTSGTHKRRTVPIRTSTTVFLGLISKLSATQMIDLYDLIFAAGVEQVFGITEEELEGCEFLLPPLSAATERDLRKLTNLICGE